MCPLNLPKRSSQLEQNPLIRIPSVQQSFFNNPIVHLIRNSLAFVSWKDRRTVMPAIKAIYRAETAEMAAARLDEFEA